MRLVWFLALLTVTMVYTIDGVDPAGSLVAVAVDEKKRESRIKAAKKFQKETAEFDLVWDL